MTTTILTLILVTFGWSLTCLGEGFTDATVTNGVNVNKFTDGERELSQFNHDLRVYDVYVRGTMCDDRDFEYDLDRDGDHLRLDYYNLNVEAVYGERRGGYCTVTFDVEIPDGWRIGVAAAEVTGRAYVTDQDSNAAIQISHSVDRGHATRISDRLQPGYYNQDFRYNDYVQARSIQWTECGRRSNELTFNTDINVMASRNGQALIAVESRQRTFSEEYGLVWERCGGPAPSPSEWVGSCRVVLETVWGQDVSDFWGNATARSESQAIETAKAYALNDCEVRRNGESVLTCAVDWPRCTAVPRLNGEF